MLGNIWTVIVVLRKYTTITIQWLICAFYSTFWQYKFLYIFVPIFGAMVLSLLFFFYFIIIFIITYYYYYIYLYKLLYIFSLFFFFFMIPPYGDTLLMIK